MRQDFSDFQAIELNHTLIIGIRTTQNRDAASLMNTHIIGEGRGIKKKPKKRKKKKRRRNPGRHITKML